MQRYQHSNNLSAEYGARERNVGTDVQRLKTRMSAQEQETTMLHKRIEGLSEGIDLSFTQLTTYQIDFEHKIDARFDALEKRMDGMEKRMILVEAKMEAMEARMVTKEDVASLKEDFARLEKTIEGNFAALEERIVGTLSKMLTVIGSGRTGE
jgi:chromosome segregation ATPase